MPGCNSDRLRSRNNSSRSPKRVLATGANPASAHVPSLALICPGRAVVVSGSCQTLTLFSMALANRSASSVAQLWLAVTIGSVTPDGTPQLRLPTTTFSRTPSAWF
jgi:hypothetical protein